MTRTKAEEVSGLATNQGKKCTIIMIFYGYSQLGRCVEKKTNSLKPFTVLNYVTFPLIVMLVDNITCCEYETTPYFYEVEVIISTIKNPPASKTGGENSHSFTLTRWR